MEQKLQELAREASDYPMRYQQLMAIRYYIQYILWPVDDQWLRQTAGYITNQKALLDQVNRWRRPAETVCFVTFNYDRIMEDALKSVGIPIAQLADYVAHNDFKLFKLHGSIDLVRGVGIACSDIGDSLNQWSAMEAVTERASELKIGARFTMATEYPSAILNDELVVPAISIPLEDKTDFECPPDHLRLLETLLPEIDRLLVIGWRATERHFLRLLSSGLRHAIKGYVVAGTGTAAKETVARLQAAEIKGKYEVSEWGFTDMITRRELDGFLGASKE